MKGKQAGFLEMPTPPTSHSSYDPKQETDSPGQDCEERATAQGKG